MNELNFKKLTSLVNSAEEFERCKYEFFNRDIDEIRKEIIKYGKGLFLSGFLLDQSESIKKAFINEILSEAIFSHESLLTIARYNLHLINRYWLKGVMPGIVNRLLKEYDIEEGYEDYYCRIIAEIYLHLGFIAELNSFLDEFCKESKDPDLLDIFEDYYHGH